MAERSKPRAARPGRRGSRRAKSITVLPSVGKPDPELAAKALLELFPEGVPEGVHVGPIKEVSVAEMRELLRKLAELPVTSLKDPEVQKALKKTGMVEAWKFGNITEYTPLNESQKDEVLRNLGRRLKRRPRGLSRLYREANRILQDKGISVTANDVRLALKTAGVVQIKDGMLCWTDDQRRAQKTSFKQFEKQLSLLRKANPKK